MTPPLNPADARLLSDHIAWMRLRNLSPATTYHRRRFVTRMAAFTGQQLLEVGEDDLDRWQRDMAERLMPRSRLSGISNITSFYEWCIEYGHRTDDPTRILIRPKRPKALPHPISEDDLQLALASSHGTRVRPMIVLGAYAGLRCGEMAKLDRNDVLDRADTPMLRIIGKGDKQRLVPMSDFVVKELRALGLPQRGPVLPRLDGGRGYNQAWTISHLLADFLHDLGIAETGHSLRHRFGTMLYAATHDLRLVQEVMGHESPLTTAGYVGYSNVDAYAAVRFLAGEHSDEEPGGAAQRMAPRRSPLQRALDTFSFPHLGPEPLPT